MSNKIGDKDISKHDFIKRTARREVLEDIIDVFGVDEVLYTAIWCLHIDTVCDVDILREDRKKHIISKITNLLNSIMLE